MAAGRVALPLADLSPSGAELRSQFRPGLRLLVSYETDPGWHHERVLLAPVIDDDWMVLTADGDVYAESFTAESETETEDWKTVDNYR